MRARLYSSRGLLSSGMFYALLVTAHLNAAEIGQLHAGTARVDYTPSSVPENQIYDHQFIRVVAFDDGEERALLIAHETKYTRDELWEEITGRIGREAGIAPEYVIMAAVHTHSGVDLGDDFNDKMMHCVHEALANLRPARIGAGRGQCKMNMSRRERDVDGDIILGKNPYAPCDQEVAVLRVDDDAGNPISIMVNWPCHAVINFPSPMLLSGDWPSVTSKYLEAALPEGVAALVTIGASGDINPLYWAPFPAESGIGKKEKRMELTARYLGDEANRVSKEIVTRPAGRISAVQRYVALPGMKRLASRAPSQEIVPGEDLHVRLSAVKVGDVVFAGLGGEVMTEIGLSLKKQSPYENTCVITHCNGSVGYLVTDQALKEGGLEPSRTRGMPGTDKALVDNLLEMIDEL